MELSAGGPRPAASPGPVAPAVLLLTLCLRPAAALVAGPAEAEPVPSLNLTFDRKSWELRWDCLENTTDVRCTMVHWEIGSIETKPHGQDCACAFGYIELHGGFTLQVRATVGARPVLEELPFPNPGLPGTAARDFSCFIYDAGFLNCSWAPGPAAPPDVQYFLFMEDMRTQAGRECPLYVAHAGTHTGCHLRDLSALGFSTYFLLNGTSPGAAVRFVDSIWNTKEMERLSPPDNVTVHCNASHCRVRWTRPRTWTVLSSMDFLYQVDLQRWRADLGRGTPLVQVAGKEEFGFPSPQPRARQVLRLRVSDVRGGPWSAWSRPVELGSDAQDTPALRLYILVVLLTLVCTLLLGFLFTRFIWIHGLCPPGPKIKMMHVDKASWEGNAPAVEKGEQEEVLIVEEVS